MTVIAIDGPAGSGKSTVARAVAERLDLEVLDTGAMYRAVTAAVLRRHLDPSDRAAVAALVAHLDVETEGGVTTLDGDDVSVEIRSSAVSAAVSVVSAHSEVRRTLRDLQRAWMDRHGGGVVEGRDIGTVVFPDADLKVFLDADPLVRAARRAAEGVLGAAEAAANIAERDHVDSTRVDSPLAEADGSMVIDTSALTVAEIVELIAEAVT
jgi:cytidylate kinase